MRINLDNRIVHTLTCVFDTVLATFLFLVCCLPVVTVGASASAMYSTMLAVVDNSCSGVIRHFFGAFRDNFRQATLLWLPDAVVGLAVAADIVVCWGFKMEPSTILFIMRGLTVFCTGLYTAMSIYLFSGISVYHMTWKQAVGNALMLTTKKLPLTLCLLAVQAAMVAAVVLVWFMAFPVIALGLILQAKLLHRILELPRMEDEHCEEEIDYG